MTLLRTAACFALTSLLVACAGETTDDGGPSPNGQASAAATPSDDTVYAVSCGGDVAPMVSGSVSPRCASGEPGTKCGGGPAPDGGCAAQDVKFHYAPPALRCVGVDVYAWNGTECVAHNTHGEGGMLKCAGKDCEKLFKSADACAAHALACAGK